jgi:hypothetical protein
MGADLSAILEKMTHTRTPPTLNINALNLIIDAYNETGRSSIYSTKPRTNVNDLLLERHDKQTKGNLGRYRSASSGDIHFFRCNGGLTYRINRCKYYYDHLMHRLSDMRVERIKGFQPYDRFVERNYYQMIQSIFAIGERHAQLGARVDRALTITHSLQQRRMATYALIAGLIFSFFPGMSWLTTAIINTTDQTHKPLIPLFIFSSAVTLLSILYVFYLILEKALRSDKLYVDIEGNNPTVMSDPDD